MSLPAMAPETYELVREIADLLGASTTWAVTLAVEGCLASEQLFSTNLGATASSPSCQAGTEVDLSSDLCGAHGGRK